MMIYTITRMYSYERWFFNEEDHKFFKRSMDEFDCVGYYTTFEEAEKAVLENRGGLDECLYEYIVIENFVPGVFACASEDYKNWWYKYDHKNCKWEPCDIPEKYKNVIGFGM